MSDIDFDELDKAVTNLMATTDTTKRNEALDDPEVKVVSLGETAADSHSDLPAAAPEVPQASETPVPIASPEPKTPLAVRRRGQFMDMVHPSSDMKSVQKPVSRQGVTLSPIGASAPVEEEKTPEVTLENTQPTEPNTTEYAVSPDLPQTPFLPDAKPEKRPLGDLSQASTVEVPVAEAPVVLQQDAPTTSQELPEELGSDLLAIESTHLVPQEQPVAVESAIEPAAEPVVEPTELPVSLDETPPVALTPEPDVELTTEAPAGNGSITQQYAETPSTGEQTNGSIYDTANYHQPIEAAAAHKKSSPLKWVILAIVLLIVGAAAGVGYFFLVH